MWHTFFGYASFIYFCIAHIPDGNFGERGGHGMTWSFILWWMKILAIFQCRSIACEWMCTWSWSWEYEKFLTRVIEFDKAQNKDKLQKHKVFHDARSLALVGIYINLSRQAVAFFYFVFLKEISSTLQGRAWFHSSNHITLFNHSESMGSLWK